MKDIVLLGSTGSIGCNACNVIRKFPEKFRVRGLAAGKNIELLAQQVLEFNPDLVSVADEACAAKLACLLPDFAKEKIVFGSEGNVAVATLPGATFAISAIVGAAGLLPTLAAIDSGKDIGLANKETLVMAGRIVMERVHSMGVQLLPVDSEHSALFQALEAGRKEDVSTIILTASGGPFRGYSKEELAKVTPQKALQHPNWSMGRKISIDSATLMNKGLEVIEAKWLFSMDAESIDVVVHPQSIVHSLVEYIDGAVVAQLGIPDMQIPIAYALSYPERLPLGLRPLSLSQCGNLEFFKPDLENFPALHLAHRVLARGGVAPAVLNAANEVAVEAFLDTKIGFLQIAEIAAQVLAAIEDGNECELADILEADRAARRYAERLVCSAY